MNLKILQPKNEAIAKANEENMRKGGDIVNQWVNEQVEEQRDKGKCAEEIADNMAKRGALKTETDRKILEGALKNKGVKSNPAEFQRRRVEAWSKHNQIQGMTNEIIRQSNAKK